MLTLTTILSVSPVMAIGPTNAGGIKPVEAWGIPWAPYNDIAWWSSGQSISPEIFGIGTPTTIVEGDLTIYVSAIPSATQDEVTGEWEGTHLMWKASHAWLENPYQKTAWTSMKFWLNGAGPVSITYSYAEGPVITKQVTEFIFFLIQYVGPGLGNSNFDEAWSFDITIQAYA